MQHDVETMDTFQKTKTVNRHPTVNDVARVAGVGASTVSRFLRGVSVRKDAAGRIQAAVASLGYTPDLVARSLRVGGSRMIGVVFPKISNAFFCEVMQCIEEEACLRGFSVVLLTHQDSLDRQMEHLATLKRYRTDGVILVATPGTVAEDVLGVLRDTPLLTFDSFLTAQVDSVLLKNREAASLAVEHLAAHGFKDIVCIAAKPEIYSVHERLTGYRESMLKLGLEPREFIATGYEDLEDLLCDRLKAGKLPEAIFSLSDLMTQQTMVQLRECLGESQHKVALVGFDEFRGAQLLDPPLTVIRQPVEAMAQSCIRMLLAKIQGESNHVPERVELDGELVVRRSCGCGA